MLRQKIDWEKVPWLMTKVKVSEEYYVNYWRHRPFQREWEGEGKLGRERKKGLQSRCHQDTGPQAPISCHLSSAQTSSPHFLFGLHNVTKEEKTVNISMNTAQKRGSSAQRLKWISEKGTLRQPQCLYVCLCEAAAQGWFPLYFVSESGFRQTGPGFFSVFSSQLDTPLPLHAPTSMCSSNTHTHHCMDLPAASSQTCSNGSPASTHLIHLIPTPTCWTEREGLDRELASTKPFPKTFPWCWHNHTR